MIDGSLDAVWARLNRRQNTKLSSLSAALRFPSIFEFSHQISQLRWYKHGSFVPANLIMIGALEAAKLWE
jgi:hypothetical protein